MCAPPLHKAPLHSLFAQGGCPRDAPAAAHWAHFAFGVGNLCPRQSLDTLDKPLELMQPGMETPAAV